MGKGKMKKLAFLSFADPTDRRSWSGTLYSEYQQLQKYYDVEWVCIKFNPVILFFVKFFNRIHYLFTKKTYMPMYSSIFMSRLAMRSVNKKISKSKYDVLFGVCTSSVQAFLDFDGPKIYMSDAVFSVMNNFYFTNLNKNCIKNANLLEKKTLEHASAVIFSSEWARNAAINDYDITKSKIFVVPFGANIETFFLNNCEKINDNKIHLLFIGVDWARKGGDIAIKTVYLLNKMQNKYKFFLDAIGGKPDYNVDKDVINLYGFINKNDKKQLHKFYSIINSAYLNILPTKAECTSIALIEASAYGLPSITYNVGGTSTNVKNGVTGYCLDLKCDEHDFADKIMTLVNDRSLYNQLSENGLKYVKKVLNWDSWGKEVNSIIDSVIKNI